MKENFFSAFQNELNIEVDFGPIMRFALVREKPYIKHFIFVEGPTDKTFYENTNITELSDHAYYFYRVLSDKYNKSDYKGKEAVFYSLKRIIDNKKLASSIDKCRFIVDRDYTKKQRSKYTRLKSTDYSRISVTKGHSMESYFFDEWNLKMVIEKVDLNLDHFLTLFNDFHQKMSYFYSLKAIITENYCNGVNIRFSKKYDDSDLFVFDFTKETYWKSEDRVKEECRRMLHAISPYSYLVKKVGELQKEIASDRMLVRGHDAFAFLEQYILQLAHQQIVFPYGSRYDIKLLIGTFNVKFG